MNEITPSQEARNKDGDRQFKDNPLLRNEWEIVTLSDHCDLYCVLTPSILMIRLFDDALDSIHYEHVNELFDVSRMCEQIKLDAGLNIQPFQWYGLLESAVIYNPPGVPLVRSVF